MKSFFSLAKKQESSGRIEDELHDLSLLCFQLKVHKKAAMNVRDQFQAVVHSNTQDLAIIKGQLHLLCERIRQYSNLESLQSYLVQESVVVLIDRAGDDLWSIVQSTQDTLLFEQISVQRDSYESDRRVDRIALRRLLRDCLQNEETISEIERMPTENIGIFINAAKLELSSLSISTQEQKIYGEFISRMGSRQNIASQRVISDFTGKVRRTANEPIGQGILCLVFPAELYGRPVVIHTATRSKRHPRPPQFMTSSAWSEFDHPNVLPLLGTARISRGSEISCISPWMENGTIRQYLRYNSNVNRVKLITDIAAGVAYLHSRTPPYVHSILDSSSVLVNGRGDAVIGGFAWAAYEYDSSDSPPSREKEMMTPQQARAEKSSTWKKKTIVFTIPTIEDDIYQFGLLAAEIIIDDEHESSVISMTVIDTILKGDADVRDPSGRAVRHGLQGELLRLLQKCVDPYDAARPSAATILATLRRLQESPSLDVPDLSSKVTLVEDRYTIFASGGFGEIRQGRMMPGEVVALKTLCVRGSVPPQLKETKRFRREATIWNKLNHPNVLPFLGIADLQGLPTSLVAPWMKNGNCVDYLNKYPDAQTMPLVQGITRGLHYLHNQEPSIIHGDLRAANILISDTGVALLADFGLAVIIEDLTRLPISSALQSSGNPRWMAYELLVGDSLVSKESDIWALGMVILELMSREMPFNEIKSYPQVVLALSSGQRPAKPGLEAERRGLSDELWALMEQCWAQDPKSRPKALDVLRRIDEIADSVHMNGIVTPK